MLVVLLVLAVFLPLLVEFLLNGILLYLVCLRSWVEIKKKHLEKEYAVAAVLSLLALFSWGNQFPLWLITTFLVQTFVLSYVVRFFEGLLKPEKKRRH
ncbi:hypothetical protein HY484_04605 [Candidatus Woesearchaeota archaeon]|nr:hypothetical protein [Candidatus Woesearchaeota archaeon]